MPKEDGPRIGKETRDIETEDDKVWLTVGTDAMPLLYSRSLISAEILSRVSRKRSTSTVIPATSYDLAKMRQILENKYSLGGVLVHGSEAEAREYSRKVEKNCPRHPRNQIALNYEIDNPQVAKYLSRSIFHDNLAKIVSKLSTGFVTRDYLTADGIKASKWIKDHWERISSKRNDIIVMFFEHSPSTSPQPSIIATIEGSVEKHSIVILGAHIDSINHWGQAPGADDNASGVSILTELLRVIVETGYVPEKTIQLMGYAAEEYWRKGSIDIASHYSSSGKKVVGMLNLDMSGNKGSTEDIYFVTDYTNPTQNKFLAELVKRYFPKLTVGNTTCGYACSDHFSWCTENVPSSFVFESTFNARNIYIHTSGDTKVQVDHILKFAKLAAVYIAELAKGSVDL